MAKAKKQTKSLTDFIVEQIKREDLYSFGDMLVGFQCPEQKVKDLIDEGIVFIEKDLPFTAFTDIDFIGGVIPFYFSQSHASKKVSGWTDPAWALEQYEIDKDGDTLSYVKLTDAIAYQMNAASVAYRMSKKLAHKANLLPKTAVYSRACMLLSAAILDRFKDLTAINCRAIATFLGNRVNDYSEWFYGVKNAWSQDSDKAHYIPRIEAFLSGKVYLSSYTKTDGTVNSFKKRKEDELCDTYIRRMFSALKVAGANHAKYLVDEGLAG